MCVDQPTWYDFNRNEAFLDRVFGWLHKRHKGTRPPISFFKDAFKLTMGAFQEQVRDKATLSHCVDTQSLYQSFWTVYVPDNQGGNNSEENQRGPKRKLNSPPSSASATGDLASAQELMRRMQSEKDRQIASLKRQVEEARKGCGKGGGKQYAMNNQGWQSNPEGSNRKAGRW